MTVQESKSVRQKIVKRTKVGTGNICETSTAAYDVENSTFHACEDTEDCGYDPNANITWCVVILDESEGWSVASESMSSASLVLLVAGTAATGTVYVASTGAQSVVSSVSSGIKFEFDPSVLINFGQSVVMSAQMNIASPQEWYGFAASFSWASLNFGILGNTKTEHRESASSQRLLSSSDETASGFSKYLETINVEEQFLFLDILAGFLLLCAASIWIVLFVRAVIKCFEHKLGEEKVFLIWKRTDVIKLFVAIWYYSFYPFVMAIFFQLSFHASLSAEDERIVVARVASATALVCLVFKCIGIISAAVSVQKKAKKNKNVNFILQRLALLEATIEGRTETLTKHWKGRYQQWWVLKLLKSAISALVVTYIFSPKPFQPVLILAMNFAYLCILLFKKPYKTQFQNDARAVYAFLGVANNIVFTIYGLPSLYEKFDASLLQFIGKIQMILNCAMITALIVCQFANKRDGISTCGDFAKFLCCRKKVDAEGGKSLEHNIENTSSCVDISLA